MEAFTENQFALLAEWRGRKYDKDAPYHEAAYSELKKAYELTKLWADKIQAKHFPSGEVVCRRKPTNQAGKFERYNWARIYPSKTTSPRQLAYTVGIDADRFLVVKIDTIHIADTDPIRRTYEGLRGPYDNNSPIVATLSANEGTRKSVDDLVSWAIDEINGFAMTYDDVAARLSLSSSSEEEILRHFDGKPQFKQFRLGWPAETRQAFCRLAQVVHDHALDWWHVDKDIEVRFGRKDPGKDRAIGVIGRIHGRDPRVVSLRKNVGALQSSGQFELTDDFVLQIEEALASESPASIEWAMASEERVGLWPDQLAIEEVDTIIDNDSADGGQKDEARVTNWITPINRIYYGPPGTGKTYEVRRLLERDYQDAAGALPANEWRQRMITDSFSGMKWWEAIAAALYELGRPARVAELRAHPFIGAVEAASRNTHVPATLHRMLGSHAVEATRAETHAPAVFARTADGLWELAGDWREACGHLVSLVETIKTPPPGGILKRYRFVTFHQSYGYEEFVEGLRPILDDEEEGGSIGYRIQRGVFRTLCDEAAAAPDQRFAIIIDEINRGNISKIFGELITLIESDKRKGMAHPLSVTLPYSGDEFSVPPNVDIIGTMNTADRSLALLDTALRRRFDFVPVYPDASDRPGAPLYALKVQTDGFVIDVPAMLTTINRRIEVLYDRDHMIGHAYFEPLKRCKDGPERFGALVAVFRDNILPLLEEYFFEDWQKIRLVLGDNQKDEAEQFITSTGDADREYRKLFGVNHALDAFAVRPRFELQPGAFTMPRAYIGIYKTLS